MSTFKPALLCLFAASTAMTPVISLAADKPVVTDSRSSSSISDAGITIGIKAKLLGDTRLKDSDISINTTNGIVTLSGSARSGEASSVAEDIAKAQEGVASVKNEITTPPVTTQIKDKAKEVADKVEDKTKSIAGKVEDTTKTTAHKTGQAVSDSWITTKVKSILLADSMTKGFKIHVKTKHQVVTLVGKVNSQAAVDQAVQLASQVKGVTSVDSTSLTVEAKS
jgi:hyperosmotically inducible protein